MFVVNKPKNAINSTIPAAKNSPNGDKAIEEIFSAANSLWTSLPFLVSHTLMV